MLNFKKRNMSIVKNFRRITLLKTGYKILLLIILKILQIFVDKNTNYQSGLSSIYQTLITYLLQCKLWINNRITQKQLHMLFVNHKQAYGKLISKSLWINLKDLHT